MNELKILMVIALLPVALVPLSHIGFVVLYERYLIPSLIAFVLLFGFGIQQLPQHARSYVTISLLVVGVTLSAHRYRKYHENEKKEWIRIDSLVQRSTRFPLVCETVLDYVELRYYSEITTGGYVFFALDNEAAASAMKPHKTLHAEALMRNAREIFHDTNIAEWCTLNARLDTFYTLKGSTFELFDKKIFSNPNYTCVPLDSSLSLVYRRTKQ